MASGLHTVEGLLLQARLAGSVQRATRRQEAVCEVAWVCSALGPSALTATCAQGLLHASSASQDPTHQARVLYEGCVVMVTRPVRLVCSAAVQCSAAQRPRCLTYLHIHAQGNGHVQGKHK